MTSRGVAAITALLLGWPALATEPGNVHVGTDRDYSPLATVEPGGTLIQASFLLGTRLEHTSSFLVDKDGAKFDSPFTANVLGRVGLTFNSRRSMAPVGLGLDLEVDAISGIVTDAPVLDGVGVPNTGGFDHTIRKAGLRFSVGPYFHILGGYMMSDWGLGLIANGGERGWEPGNALFHDARGGDNVIRVAVASGPTTPAGLFVALAYDWVQRDDSVLDGDKANNITGLVSVGRGGPYQGGLYVAYRNQESEGGATLNALAIDAAIDLKFDLTQSVKLRVEGELAYLIGKTTLAPTTDFPEHDIQQLGAALRVGVDAGSAGGVLDFLYASGDQNFDDAAQNGFKADSNYQLGFLAYRYVMAAQTARAPHTASNLELVGRPAEDLDRFPTRGSMTNTISIYPRAWYRPIDGIEIYAGPLIALSEVPITDPLNTRIAGGDARNALDGKPGNYIGTEIDVGLRYTGLFYGTQLQVGLEYGVFLPGSAFQNKAGETPEPVHGARFMLEYKL